MTARTGQLGPENHCRTAMTVRLGQSIWDMTTGVTMGQDSPDRPAWTAATGEKWTKLLVQDKWDNTAEIEQMWQDSTDETYRTREDIWDMMGHDI
jgi:hypothetical protein